MLARLLSPSRYTLVWNIMAKFAGDWNEWHSTHPEGDDTNWNGNDDGWDTTVDDHNATLWDTSEDIEDDYDTRAASQLTVMAFGQHVLHDLTPYEPIYRLVFNLNLPSYSENSYTNGDLEYRDAQGLLIPDTTLMKDVQGQRLYIGWPAGVGG